MLRMLRLLCHRYDRLFFSISPAQGSSIVDAIPHEKRDCAILEEPEHLNWWEREPLLAPVCHGRCSFAVATQTYFLVRAGLQTLNLLICAGRNRWTDEFQHVVGVMHTNYYQYVLEEAGAPAYTVNLCDHLQCADVSLVNWAIVNPRSLHILSLGQAAARVIRRTTTWLTRIHCHKVDFFHTYVEWQKGISMQITLSTQS